VLYNSVVVWLSECLPVGHESTTVPALLAGQRGRRAQGGQLRRRQERLQQGAHADGALADGRPGERRAHFGSQIITELKA
jgi:hypothetical protein